MYQNNALNTSEISFENDVIIYAKDKNWRELTKRLKPVGLLNVGDKDLLKLIE